MAGDLKRLRAAQRLATEYAEALGIATNEEFPIGSTVQFGTGKSVVAGKVVDGSFYSVREGEIAAEFQGERRVLRKIRPLLEPGFKFLSLP